MVHGSSVKCLAAGFGKDDIDLPSGCATYVITTQDNAAAGDTLIKQNNHY